MTIHDRAKALSEKIAAQLRVRQGDLDKVTSRAGRRIPRRLRADAQIVIDAEAMSTHPKLARLVNEKQVRRAEKRLGRFLDRQDPKTARRNEILDLLAKIAFVIVSVVLAVFFWLLSRGYFD